MTPADAAVIAALEEVDLPITSRQLRSLRTHGLIELPRPGAGRGRGRPSVTYREGTVERVITICLIRQLQRKVTYDDLPIRLFLFGVNQDYEVARQKANERARELAALMPAPHETDKIIDIVSDTTQLSAVDAFRRDLLKIGDAANKLKYKQFLESENYAYFGDPWTTHSNEFLRSFHTTDDSRIWALFEKVQSGKIQDAGERVCAPSKADVIWARDVRIEVLKFFAYEIYEARVSDDSKRLDFACRAFELLNIEPHQDMMQVCMIAYYRPELEEWWRISNEVQNSEPIDPIPPWYE